MSAEEILKLLPKYVQALYSDSVLYFSGEETIATTERKLLVSSNIKAIREQLDSLEKLIG
jgi:hypothetical protein